MRLLDTFRKPKQADLADAASSKLPSGGATELGVAGEAILAGFENEEQRIDNVSVAEYVKMRQNDGTVSSLYLLMTLPILSTASSFEADEDDANNEQADFVNSVFTDPPHKGGMSIPFGIVKADMVRAVLEGFRVYELVLGLNVDNKVVYRKIAPRDGSTQDQSILLKRDATGEYDGFHQRVTYHGEWKDVTIPAWKSFLFTYSKDKNFLYGESAFKAAYYHYKKKHKLYYLSELAVQVGAVPPKIITGPDNIDKDLKARILREFDKLGIRSTAYIKDTYKVDTLKTADGRIDPMPLIDHHDTQMARSILAQFLMLGTTAGSKGGSHALSADQSDLFIQALKGVMTAIEDHINFYLIPGLIDLNFAKPAYPQFHFEDITSDTKSIITDAFTQLVTSGKITDSMARGLENRVAEALDIDLAAEQKMIDIETKKKIADAKANGVEVDALGNPLPVVAPTAVPPKDEKKPGKPPVKQTPEDVINQSDPAADDDPKVGSGSGRSHPSSSVFRSLR